MPGFQEDIFKGATRPSMLAGVPMVPMVVVTILMIILVFWSINFVSLWMAAPMVTAYAMAVLWMRSITMTDDQRLAQMILLLKLTIPQINRKLWKVRSYCPLRFRSMKSVQYRK